MRLSVPKAPWSAAARRRLSLAFHRGARLGAARDGRHLGLLEGGVKPPHSKALRAFSCGGGPKDHGIFARNDRPGFFSIL
jgi:hypothetical protein